MYLSPAAEQKGPGSQQELDQKAIKVINLHGNQKEGSEAMLQQLSSHAPAQAPLEAGAPLEHPSVM